MQPEKPFGILIVDDEPNIRSGLAKGLAGQATRIETAGDADEAMAKFVRHGFPLVVMDVRLKCGVTGIELLGQMIHQRPGTCVIVITAHGTVETAVEAMRAGAYDFVPKPVDLNLVHEQVRRARSHYELQQENQQLRSQIGRIG
jgi:two-component system NtrC family response regulator